ncbi:polysaccharide deacetylase family protein [Rosistilla oblonga]|uniref:polysaccharide deacetylase family protein n=1 Tax=Rosistilla oblonga TaxID=2527990 RepID=UPI003A986790
MAVDAWYPSGAVFVPPTPCQPISLMNHIRLKPKESVVHRVFSWVLVLTVLMSSVHADDVGPPAPEELLALTAEASAQLQHAQEIGAIEIAPVHLPTDSAGDCNHLGWPIATMTGDTIVVMHRRIPGHKAKGAGSPDPEMSYGIVLRSDDGGKTWSPPYDLRDCMTSEDRLRGGVVPLSHRAKFDKSNKSTLGYKVHLHAIGTTRDGAVVAINNHGVFRSDDRGRTWKHFPKALRDDNFPHQIVNLGPRILDHPERGLMAFGNWFGEADTYHKLSNKLVTLTSADGGANWSVEEHDVGFPQYEPSVLMHENRFLSVTRDQTKVRSHKQMDWALNSPPTILDTNLKDPRLVDTVDFSFNPVTKRFEMVRSERHRMELWLWSMAPGDWGSGNWRRECRLLAREGTFYSTADGFHPAGAVIDVKRGVQHVFVYAGHPNGPAGVFRITRTLDTPRLKTVLDTAPQVRTPTPLTEGGIVMTFDDRNFNDWVKALPLFDEFGVKATFFISGEIDGPARRAIQKLTEHGHAIGSHSVNHLKAVEYFETRSPEAFMQREIDPQMKAFKAAGVAPVSFAYPMSRNNAATNEKLLEVFRHLRTGKGIAAGTALREDDAFFVPAAKIAEHGCLYGQGIDYAPLRPDRTYEQLDGALQRAAENREIIVLYAHRISESGRGHFVTPEALTRIFRKANELGLKFYTFDELP